MICAPKRKVVGSNPAGEAKAKHHPMGGASLYTLVEGIRTGFGGEWSSCGAPEPKPERACRRVFESRRGGLERALLSNEYVCEISSQNSAWIA